MNQASRIQKNAAMSSGSDRDSDASSEKGRDDTGSESAGDHSEENESTHEDEKGGSDTEKAVGGVDDVIASENEGQDSEADSSEAGTSEGDALDKLHAELAAKERAEEKMGSETASGTAEQGGDDGTQEAPSSDDSAEEQGSDDEAKASDAEEQGNASEENASGVGSEDTAKKNEAKAGDSESPSGSMSMTPTEATAEGRDEEGTSEGYTLRDVPGTDEEEAKGVAIAEDAAQREGTHAAKHTDKATCLEVKRTKRAPKHVEYFANRKQHLHSDHRPGLLEFSPELLQPLRDAGDAAHVIRPRDTRLSAFPGPALTLFAQMFLYRSRIECTCNGWTRDGTW